MLTILVGISGCAIFIYLFFIKPHFYWTNRGILQPSFWECISELMTTIIGTETIAETKLKVYRRFPNVRAYGNYHYTYPLVVIKDQELIKDLMVTNFDHFTDHRPFGANKNDTCWSKNVFALEGDKWRKMRNTLSPTFTGSKMRTMFTMVDHTVRQHINHYLKVPQELIEMEVRDFSGRLTADIIATCAFGLDNDSLKNRSNDFYASTKILANMVTYKNLIMLAFNQTFPTIAKFFSFNLAPAHVSLYFKNMVADNMRIRKEHNIRRSDMISLLMERQEQIHEEISRKEDSIQLGQNESSKTVELSNDDIAAQVMVFLLAGFGTTASFFTLMLNELALHPEIQTRLQEEIDEVLESTNGKITPQMIQSMKYLDMVISESLRISPSGYQLDRLCTKPYTIEPKHEGEKAIHLKVGDVISFCFYAVHHDPKFYPNPEHFDPERFNEENRRRIPSGAYLPFALGPRNCLGSRFALMELKVTLFHLLSKFDIVPTEKTIIPIKLSRSNLFVSAREPVRIGYRKRKLNKFLSHFDAVLKALG